MMRSVNDSVVFMPPPPSPPPLSPIFRTRLHSYDVRRPSLSYASQRPLGEASSRSAHHVLNSVCELLCRETSTHRVFGKRHSLHRSRATSYVFTDSTTAQDLPTSTLLPSTLPLHVVQPLFPHSMQDVMRAERTHDLTTAVMLSIAAGVCSAVGGVVAVALAGYDMPLHRLACSQAALGAALLFLGCCDLLPEAAVGISGVRAALFFAMGALGSAAAARFMRIHVMEAIAPGLTGGPAGRQEPDRGELEERGAGLPQRRFAWVFSVREDSVWVDRDDDRQRVVLRGEVLVVGLVTFVSLSVHNLLEGMSILFAVHEGLESGLRLAAAISLENIPEGLCIALPLYFATRRKAMAIRLAFISGMLEPVGVLLPGLFLEKYITQTSISSVLAIIAGILVFVALAEMLPLAVKTVGTGTMASLSVWMGCGVLSATLFQPLLMYHARVGLVQ